MPLPKPKPDEEKDEFLQRCISDPTMEEEYPDQSQRIAICYSLWREKKAVIAKNFLEKILRGLKNGRKNKN